MMDEGGCNELAVLPVLIAFNATDKPISLACPAYETSMNSIAATNECISATNEYKLNREDCTLILS